MTSRNRHRAQNRNQKFKPVRIGYIWQLMHLMGMTKDIVWDRNLIGDLTNEVESRSVLRKTGFMAAFVPSNFCMTELRIV